MEEDPFAIVEAMTIEGFATGSARGFLYLRAEYPLAAARMAARRSRPPARPATWAPTSWAPASPSTSRSGAAPAPTSAARRRPSSTRSRASAASRATSRPSRSRSGLFGKPTAVNNVETLVNVPAIVADGGARLRGDRHARARTGPKLFCLSGARRPAGRLRGRVRGDARRAARRSPAAWPAGGRSRRSCSAAPPASSWARMRSTCRSRSRAPGRRARRSAPGVVMVFDETADLVGTLLRIAAFFRDESCGQCVPCRIGTVRQEELLARLADRPAARVAGRRAGPPRATSAGRCATRASAASARRPRSAIESALRAGLVDFVTARAAERAGRAWRRP